MRNQINIFKLWNSSTPLFSELKRSLNGFYYIIWDGKGVIIDPGYGFTEIFSKINRTIRDLDYVIVTHDHPDHCSELTNIITLLHEYNEENEIKHNIYFYVSKGTYNKYKLYFNNKKLKKYVTQLKYDSNYNITKNITIMTVKNKHREIFRSMALGLKIVFKTGKNTNFQLGITGDTGFFSQLSLFYNNLDLLITHIGTIENLKRKKLLPNHLGYRGIVNLLKKMNDPPSLTLISEWGEELKGLRKTIGDSLQSYIPMSIILPADLGLRIAIPDILVYVEETQRYEIPQDVKLVEDYGTKLRYSAY